MMKTQANLDSSFGMNLCNKNLFYTMTKQKLTRANCFSNRIQKNIYTNSFGKTKKREFLFNF